MFAYNAACASGNGLIINGSRITVSAGGIHSNGRLTVNGSNNTFSHGSYGGPNNCSATVSGSGNTFAGSPQPIRDPCSGRTRGTTAYAPIPCTYTAANFTFNTSNTTIPTGTYCATGTVTFNGSNLTGNITVIAQRIVLNGSSETFTPHQQDLLFHQTGTTQLTLNGSNQNFAGAIFAPTATIVLNGSSTQHITGLIEGLNVTLSGSNFSIG